MIGGGIFAVLGLAIALAGHAVALTLAIGGGLALLTGHSYGVLGLRFRDAGGSFTYIEQAFPTFVSGVAGWLLVAGYVGTLALYATAFGDYGAALFRGSQFPHYVAALLAASALALFLAVNLLGARLSGGVELSVVSVKLGLLGLFAIVGFTGVKPSHFTPVFNHGILTPLVAVALIFVAYEGFELIPNAMRDMRNPERDLPRALLLSIGITTFIYVVVAIAALGNLTPQEIQHDQEYVLAVAAQPTLGHAGFILIGIAAVLSTASAINATLFGAARLAMVMARKHALPSIFARREKSRPVPWIALLVLTALAVALTLESNLSEISTFASATFLLIFTGVNVAAFRFAPRHHSSRWLHLIGAIATGISFVLLIGHTWLTQRRNLLWLCCFYSAALLLQIFARRGHDSPPSNPPEPTTRSA